MASIVSSLVSLLIAAAVIAAIILLTSGIGWVSGKFIRKLLGIGGK